MDSLSRQRRIQDVAEWGANPREDYANLLFGKIFAENCMKMKEFGPRGGLRPWLPTWIRHCSNLCGIADYSNCGDALNLKIIVTATPKLRIV